MLGPLLPSQTTLSWAPTACAERGKQAGGGFVITINTTTIIIYINLIILFMTIINSSNQWIVKYFKSFWMVYFELFTVDYLNHHHYHLHNPHNVQVLQKLNFIVEINLSQMDSLSFPRWTPSNSQALVPATLSQILFQSSGFPDQLRDKTNDDQLQTREEPYFTTANKEFLSCSCLGDPTSLFFLLFVKPSFLQHS